MAYISQDSLPRTIRDAAHLTNIIGVKYLWIDALCIVQDDPPDWETHVSMMGDIYQNAHLVIAAGSAKHSDDSFLHVPDRPRTEVVPFSYKDRSGLVCFKKLQGIGVHENYESMYGGIDPLDERAWALQERVLATRLIIYSSTELQWICRADRICESSHPENHRENLVIRDTTELRDLHSLWHRLVKDYSKRHLTFESDKLPAIAGLASKMALITKSEYCAGLWKNNLIHDICWERHLWESVPWTAPEKWRAPSFSWASVEGNIFYNDESIAGRMGTCLSEILASSCTPSSLTSPLGEVVDGFINIQGPVREARIYTHPLAARGFNWTHILHFVDSYGKLPFRADVPLARSPSGKAPHSPDSNHGRVTCSQYTANRAVPGSETRLDGECAWIIVIGYWYEHYSHRDEVDMWISCIVLGKADQRPNSYQRLGFVNTHWPPWRSKFGDPEFNDLVPFMYDAEKTEITIV
ncbi:putative HET-domain-containing protein [Seiridium cardinale]